MLTSINRRRLNSSRILLTCIKDMAKVTRYPCAELNRKGHDMMNGYDMGYGGIWMVVVLVLAILAIAALVKYLRK